MSLSLAERLFQRIERDGPITFHDWMQAALYDPSAGYYNREDLPRWGRAGDYRTSPERSELFGQTFAAYFAELFDKLGRPAEWTIIECGGGNGLFALTVLETLQAQFPEVYNAARYCFSELSSSATLRARERLLKFGRKVNFQTLNDLDAIDHGVVFANELLDAFPVHRVTRVNGELSELYVTIGDEQSFAWLPQKICDPNVLEFCEQLPAQVVDGQIIEVNPGIADWLTAVAGTLRSGFIVTVDYGAEASELYGSPERHGGTLRGYSRHQFIDNVLSSPGDYDLTTTVDWTLVQTTGERLGLSVVEFQGQDRFLIDHGILAALQTRLTTASSEAEKLAVTTAAREMILPGGMASSFQVMVQRSDHE